MLTRKAPRERFQLLPWGGHHGLRRSALPLEAAFEHPAVGVQSRDLLTQRHDADPVAEHAATSNRTSAIAPGKPRPRTRLAGLPLQPGHGRCSHAPATVKATTDAPSRTTVL